MAQQPQVKAAHMKSILAFLGTLPPLVKQKVLDKVPTETLRSIQEDSKLKWLPASCDVEITESVHEVLSPQQFKKFWMDYGMSTLENPLLKQAFHAAIRLFGLSISRLITWTPRTFYAYYRGCGELTVGDRSDRHCNMLHTAIPMDLAKSSAWIDGFAYTFAAIFPLTGIENGEVTIHDYEPGQGRARYHFRW